LSKPFAALAALPTGGAPDLGAVVAICAAHGVEILLEPEHAAA